MQCLLRYRVSFDVHWHIFRYVNSVLLTKLNWNVKSIHSEIRKLFLKPNCCWLLTLELVFAVCCLLFWSCESCQKNRVIQNWSVHFVRKNIFQLKSTNWPFETITESKKIQTNCKLWQWKSLMWLWLVLAWPVFVLQNMQKFPAIRLQYSSNVIHLVAHGFIQITLEMMNMVWASIHRCIKIYGSPINTTVYLSN